MWTGTRTKIYDFACKVKGEENRLQYTLEYHVIEAENGKTGLEKIKSKIPDLVISDIMMPCLIQES